MTFYTYFNVWKTGFRLEMEQKVWCHKNKPGSLPSSRAHRRIRLAPDLEGLHRRRRNDGIVHHRCCRDGGRYVGRRGESRTVSCNPRTVQSCWSYPLKTELQRRSSWMKLILRTHLHVRHFWTFLQLPQQEKTLSKKVPAPVHQRFWMLKNLDIGGYYPCLLWQIAQKSPYVVGRHIRSNAATF